MKYKKGSFLIIKFSKIGSKKKTSKGYDSYGTAKDDLDKWLKKNPESTGVIVRVIHNSTVVEDKWSYNK